MSSPIETYATVYNLQVADSEVTLVERPVATPLVQAKFTAPVNNPVEPSPHTPPLETTTPAEQPTCRPPLTIAPNSDTEEGEIVLWVHNHNYPLSPQSLINVIQGHPELDAGTLHTIAIGLANMAIGHTFQHLKAKSEIKQLCKELTDL